VVTATEERSQARNREIAFERLLVKLRRLARRRRRRVATRKPKAVRARELEDKRQTAEKKRLRARVREPGD
jgi:ribosome-associated protein